MKSIYLLVAIIIVDVLLFCATTEIQATTLLMNNNNNDPHHHDALRSHIEQMRRSASDVPQTEKTYYVSPKNGNNSNAGESPSDPWQTLKYASQFLALVMLDKKNKTAAGKSFSVLLARNTTFLNDPLVIDASVSRIGKSVVVSSYGDESLPAPLLQHTKGLTDGSVCLSINGISGVKDGFGQQLVVSSLHFSGCKVGISLTSASNDESDCARNLVLKYNFFSDINTPELRYTPPNPQWAASIELNSGRFENVSIHNNVASRIDTFFTSRGFSVGLRLQSNTVEMCGGNCYSVGGGNIFSIVGNVFLRNRGLKLFMYGITSIIVGGNRHVQISENEFESLSEYFGGVDGCAADLETSADNVSFTRNTIYHSWGSGLMIFGHKSTGTSKHVQVADNIFQQAGCIQTRGDQASVAVMCGGGSRPSATLENNIIFECEGPNHNPPFHVSSSPPDCAKYVKFINNTIVNSTHNVQIQQVERPMVQTNPPSPACKETKSTNKSAFNVQGKTRTNQATIRYSLDGSAPTEHSPIMPEEGIDIPWPSPAKNVNMKSFKQGWIPSIASGTLIPSNYVLCREAPGAVLRGPAGEIFSSLRGNFDSISVDSAKVHIRISGWVVDPLLPRKGWGPVTISVSVDSEPVFSFLANGNRPDLPKAGVAPNPDHGFDFLLPQDVSIKLLSSSKKVHLVEIQAIGSPSSTAPKSLSESSYALCSEGKCEIQK